MTALNVVYSGQLLLTIHSTPPQNGVPHVVHYVWHRGQFHSQTSTVDMADFNRLHLSSRCFSEWCGQCIDLIFSR